MAIPYLGDMSCLGALTVAGTAIFNGGGQQVRLQPGTQDFTLLGFYARTATPTTRSGYIGFGTAATTALTIANEAGGGMTLTATGAVAITNAATVGGTLTVTGNSTLSATFLQRAGTATATTQTQNSRGMAFRTAYWDGAASVDEEMALLGTRGSTTPGDSWLQTSATLKALGGLYDGSTSRAYSSVNNVPVVGGRNLLANSSYETLPLATTEILIYNGGSGATPSIAQDNTTAFLGSSSLLVTPTAAGSGMVHYAPSTVVVPANTNVVLSAWVKGTAGNTISIASRLRVSGVTTNTPVVQATGSKSFTLTGSWQRIYSLPVTHTADFSPGLQIRQGVGTTTFNVDAVQAEIGDVPTFWAAAPGETSASNGASGEVAGYVGPASALAVVNSANTTSMAVTWSSIAGHKYKITGYLSGDTDATAGGSVDVHFDMPSPAVSKYLIFTNSAAASTFYYGGAVGEFTETVTQTRTVNVYMIRTVGTFTVRANTAILNVEDITPGSSLVVAPASTAPAQNVVTGQVASTNTVTLTLIAQTLPGATYTVPVSGTYQVTFAADMTFTGSDGALAAGLYLDGTAVAPVRQIIYAPVTSGARSVQTQTSLVTATAGQVLTLQAFKLSGTGTSTAGGQHSGFTVVLPGTGNQDSDSLTLMGAF